MTRLLTLAVLLATVPAAAQPPAPVIEYYHLDAIGSVRAVTDASGTVVRRHDYAPFGEDLATVLGADQLRFAGKERDRETGLDYLGARHLNAAWGRFATVDPLLDVGQSTVDPQRWNRYSYVRNSPSRFSDPTGAAIELLGSTSEARNAELYAIASAMGDPFLANLLYIDDRYSPGRFFVGVRGDLTAFSQVNALAARLAEVIGDPKIVQFTLASKIQTYADSFSLLGAKEWRDVGRLWGGGATIHSRWMPSGHTSVVLDPTRLSDPQARKEGIPGASLQEAVSHELLGHALALIRGHAVGGLGSSRELPFNVLAVEAENLSRRQGGANRGQKRWHH